MKRFRGLAWLMLAVWASWLSAAQAVAVAKSPLGPWMPDLGLLLIVACAGRFHPRDVPLATLVVALARVAHSVEPPGAVLAGCFGLSLAVQSVRRVVEVDRPLVRIALAGGGVLLFSLWLVTVHAVRIGHGVEHSLADALPLVLPGVVATSFAGLLFVQSFALLPGLTPLRTRRW